MAHPNPLKSLFLILFLGISSLQLNAQDDPYKFTFAPDLWYNDVDGIRVGIRTLGEVEGTFKDGPHRLDAGLWVGTWLPKYPFSYYVSFTEPLNSFYEYGNEPSIQLISSIRTGYTQHRFQFNKRWQKGFDEYQYKELSVYFSREKMFESEYRPYTALWQDEWKSLFGLDFLWSANPQFGQFLGKVSIKQDVNDETENFTVGTIELVQRIDLNEKFKLRLRFFGGMGSEFTAPEYLFLSSMNSPQNWIEKGVSRAKGTIPTPWLEAGSFHVGGGANLRGYLNRDIEMLNTFKNADLRVLFPLYRTMLALNTEFEFPNPINRAIENISVIGDLTEIRTYVFADAGRGNDFSIVQDPDGIAQNVPMLVPGAPEDGILLADAGIGIQFSFNIPDYLGKDRGIFIRYDVPFWLSQPGESESNISFRQLIGLGAIISF